MAISTIDEAGLGIQAYGNRNLIINGAMQVAQRGSVSNTAANGYYGPDRYKSVMSAPSFAVDISQDTDAPQGFKSSLKYETSTARTGTATDDYAGIAYYAEIQDVIPYVWAGNSHVTASFWVKSSIAGEFSFNINVDETNSGNSGDRVLYHSLYTINAVNTWEYKTVTIPLSFLDSYSLLSGYAGANKGLEVTWVVDLSSGGTRDDATLGWNTTEGRNFVASSGGGADTGFFSTVGATFKITGCQLEIGETATPFEHILYSDQLARCQRYCMVFEGPKQRNWGVGRWENGGDIVYVNMNFPTELRATPTATLNSTNNLQAVDPTVAWYNVASIQSIHQTGVKSIDIGFNVTGATITNKTFTHLAVNSASGTAKITFDAEL
jgi:hypothetical protein